MKYNTPRLDLNEIQGDLLVGMQKNAELFLFFKIADVARFKAVAREYVVGLLTHDRTVQERERMVAARRRGGGSGGGHMPWLGVNLGFTKDGLTQLLGPNRPRMDHAFERGADDPETIAALNDPPPSKWLRSFLSDRIDAVFLIAGPDKFFVTSHGNALRGRLGSAIKTVYSEIGNVRPGRGRGHEHFGFLDGISQPGIRGLTPVSRPSAAPEQGLPGQDLIWAGEFVLGYPGQDPRDPVKPGPTAPLPAPWAKNGSYMVFRRLEQRVPEFRAFVATQATRLGIYSELLAARMVRHPPKCIVALGALQSLSSDSEAFAEAAFLCKNLSQIGQERRVKRLRSALTQSLETGTKQSLGAGEITSLGNQLSFKPAAVGIVATQAVLFGVIFQLSNRAVGSFQISEPERDLAATPGQCETQ